MLYGLLGILAAACVFLAVALAYLAPVSAGSEVPLSSVESMAAAGRVQTATLHDADARVTGTYRAEPGASAQSFWAAYPAGDDATALLLQRLTSGAARVSVDHQAAKATVGFIAGFVLPSVLVADILALLALGLRVLGLAGRPGDRQAGARPATPGERFSDVAGFDEVIATLDAVAAQLRRSSGGRGTRALRGLLIAGPPGGGKTLLARALSGEAGARLVSDPAALTQVEPAAPAVLLVEEVDSLSGTEAQRLLAWLDRHAEERRVLLVATTSRPRAVDPALLRRGRLERRLTLELPAALARRAILALHLRRHLVDPAVDLDDVARRSAGMSGSDLAALVAEAARLSAATGRHRIGALELDDALHRVAPGSVLSPDERRRAAVHESGHAVVAAALGRGRHVRRVSVLGHTERLARPPEADEAERDLRSRSELLAELTMLCGGVAAEELYFDEPSTAGEGDLRDATALARAMATRYGMTTTLGRARRDAAEGGEEVDREVRRLIDDATSAATERLQRCQGALVDLALLLERDEVVEGETLRDLLLRALEVEIRGFVEGTAPAAPVLELEPPPPPPDQPPPAPAASRTATRPRSRRR